MASKTFFHSSAGLFVLLFLTNGIISHAARRLSEALEHESLPYIPSLLKPEVPTLPKPEVPELPKPEIPTLPKPEVLEHSVHRRWCKR
ncbi:hypothetical protein QJS10_CPA09g00817 [Acorus calamus]|uniref:Uncharacterized protein n=1 Tax=Acorus calamus TaxID=4465 RepID=A0AAV9E6P4_ACOCL|nr:hypothetical protein QJS10_CPA09g00817 [Acorus calamus]